MKKYISEDLIKIYFPKLDEKCNDRLYKGMAEYGDESFRNSVGRTIVEVQEELEDVRNWAGIAWTKMEKIREMVNSLGSLGILPCPEHPNHDGLNPPLNMCEHCWELYVLRKIKREVLHLVGE